MSKVSKLVFTVFGLIILVGFSTCVLFSKKLPVGVDSPKTTILVDRMWKVLNKNAWDTTRYVKWVFRGKHHYVWDKSANLASIKWKDVHVLLDPTKVDGVVYRSNKLMDGESKNEYIQKAWSYWCNDMFWLIAPFKVKDAGTVLSIIEHTDGDRLKISYVSGGVTPGDAYVWIFDKDGLPVAYEMYTSIIPIQGVKASWEGWTELSTGALVSTQHKMAKFSLMLDGVSGGNRLSDVGLTEDIWKEIRTSL